MITEDYVSFETAKLLKDKGFDEKCRTYYKVFHESRIAAIYHSSENRGVSEDDPNEILCPTLQMAMKWLREVYNFHIWVEPNHDKEGLYNVHVKVGWWSNNWAGVGYNTYEEACEAAIKYCLKHSIK